MMYGERLFNLDNSELPIIILALLDAIQAKDLFLNLYIK